MHLPFRAEASCASVVRAARNFVSDVGRKAASKSVGLVRLSQSTEKNAERDCHRAMVNQHNLTLPVEQSTLKTDEVDGPSIPVLHLQSWAQFLVDNNHLHLLCGLTQPHWERETAMLERFWELYERQHPGHPVYEKARAGNLRLSATYPLVMHGDEGRGRKRNAYLVISFHSLLGRGVRTRKRQLGGRKKKKSKKSDWVHMRPNYTGHTYTSRFLFSSLPKALYTGHNEYIWEALMSAATADIQYMLDTGVRDAVHGRGQINFAVLNIVGDWPFLVDSAGMLRSFRNVQKHKTRSKPPIGICHLCAAGQLGVDFEQINSVNPTWLGTMHTQSLWADDAEPSSLAGIPHVPGELGSVWAFDIFHTWHLGVARSFLGSFMVLLAELQPEGNIDCRFASLSDDFLAWCRSAKRRPHVLKLSKEIMGYPTTTTYPGGTWHKGDLSRVLMQYVQFRFQRDGNGWNPTMQLAGRAATSINSCLALMYDIDSAWWTPKQAKRIGNLGMDFLKLYARLAKLAFGEGRMLWVLQPKHHALHHIFLSMIIASDKGPVLSCICFGTQADEDFIGRPSRLSRRVTPRPEQSCRRVLGRYLQHCYAEWTKAGFIVRPTAHAGGSDWKERKMHSTDPFHFLS